MFSSSKFFVVAAAVISLSACATDRTFGASPNIDVTDLAELPAPSGQFGYSIGPSEKLDIQVVGAEGLSGTYFTDGSGDLDFPFLGKVAVGGQPPSVAARAIENGLRGRYLRDPQVRIVPEELVPSSISIGGEVERPGSYPVTGEPTLLRMVNVAEGLTEFAKTDDVLVMRTVEGQSYIGVFNIAAIQRGNYPDPRLYADDIVMVGDSPARRRIQTLLQFVPVLTSSVVLVERLSR